MVQEYKCDLCEKFFSQKGNLDAHLRTHTGEKPYKCDQCGKAFSQKAHLDRHLISHTGEKPYKCDKCDKSFTQKGYLTTHLLTHTGQKPYKCDQCDKTFSQKRFLGEHILSHSGERPYKCEQCDKSFTVKRRLGEHMMTHSKDKPYKCEHCDKGFYRKREFNRHLIYHTGEKLYSCDDCDEAFVRQVELTKHLRVVHARKGVRKLAKQMKGAIGFSQHADSEYFSVDDFLFCDVALKEEMECKEEEENENSSRHYHTGRGHDPALTRVTADNKSRITNRKVDRVEMVMYEPETFVDSVGITEMMTVKQEPRDDDHFDDAGHDGPEHGVVADPEFNNAFPATSAAIRAKSDGSHLIGATATCPRVHRLARENSLADLLAACSQILVKEGRQEDARAVDEIRAKGQASAGSRSGIPDQSGSLDPGSPPGELVLLDELPVVKQELVEVKTENERSGEDDAEPLYCASS